MLAGSTGYYSASAAARWGHDVFLTRTGERVKVTHVVSHLDDWADLVESPHYSDAVWAGKIVTWIERHDRLAPVEAAGSEAAADERSVSFVSSSVPLGSRSGGARPRGSVAATTEAGPVSSKARREHVVEPYRRNVPHLAARRPGSDRDCAIL